MSEFSLGNQEFFKSPVRMVSDSTSVSEAVHLMRTQNIGSLLISVSGKNAFGIFTERDLLRAFPFLQPAKADERPVRDFMSYPVYTLPLDRSTEAARLMVRHRIRHVPLLKEENSVDVAGIVSMRQLFELYLERGVEPFTTEKSSTDRLAWGRFRGSYISNDKSVHDLLMRVLAPSCSIELQQTQMSELLRERETFIRQLKNDILIIDIDGHAREHWSKILRDINNAPSPPLTVVVFDPQQLTVESRKVLHRIGASSYFAVFEKPVDVVRLVKTAKSNL